MKRKERILITGVNGFIGSALRRYFQKKQKHFELFGLDLYAKPISGRIWRGDLNSHKQIESILRKCYPHYILHFTGGRPKNKRDHVRLNCHFTKNLLESIRTIDKYSPRIIIPGSAAEYGIAPKKRRLLRENDTLNPIASYGLAKRRQIQLTLKFSQNGHDVVVPRIFNIFGTGTPDELVAGSFASQVVKIERGEQQPIIRTGTLAGGRDFLDVDDVCSAIFCLMQYGKSGQVYNVCSGKKVVTKKLLYELIALSRVKDIKVQEDIKGHLAPFDAVGSNAKIRSLSRWKPKISLQRSLKNTLEFYRAI